LTLPEDIIEALRSIDDDLSRAVTRVVQPLVSAAPSPIAEVVSYGRRAVIVVPWSRELRDRTGLELVPLPDGRALIALGDHLTASELELKLGDAIADPALTGEERGVFEALAEILTNARRGDESVLLRNIIVLQLASGNSPSRTRQASSRPHRSHLQLSD
jgi:hypothetical protein